MAVNKSNFRHSEFRLSVNDLGSHSEASTASKPKYSYFLLSTLVLILYNFTTTSYALNGSSQLGYISFPIEGRAINY